MTATAQSDGARAGAGLPAAGVLDELSGAFSSARAALAGFLELRDGLLRARTAFRAVLARPSTLALAAGEKAPVYHIID